MRYHDHKIAILSLYVVDYEPYGAEESTTAGRIYCRFAADKTVYNFYRKLWLQFRCVRGLRLSLVRAGTDQPVAAICCYLQRITARNSGCFRCYFAAAAPKSRGIPRASTGAPLFFSGNNSDISGKGGPFGPGGGAPDLATLIICYDLDETRVRRWWRAQIATVAVG